MTASVSGYSIIQGFTSTLDTMLPSAWTSSQPQLVGLWSQRMGKFALHPASVPSLIFCCFSRGHGRVLSGQSVSHFQGAAPTKSPALPQPIILIWFNSEAILLGLKQEPEVAYLAATTVGGILLAGALAWALVRALAATGVLSPFASGREQKLV